MRLYLFRHAPAEPLAPGRTDAERALTARGARRMRRAARGLWERGVRLDGLCTSPWTRARQTARCLAPLVRGPIEELELLARAPGPALLRELAARAEERAALGLVGHQPWLGELLAFLALGSPARAAAFRLARGGLAVLEGRPERAGMRLRSLRSLRDLAR